MDNQKAIDSFNLRKKKVEKQYMIAFLFIALGGIALFLTYNQNSNLNFIPMILFAGGIIYFIIGASAFSKLKKEFKKDFLKNIFSVLIPGIEYSPHIGLNPMDVYATEFLKKADRFHSEDYLSGKIDDIDFISSDVRLEERRVRHTKNGTQVYYVPYFVGRVFKFDFHKELVGHMQVLESGRPLSRRPFNKVELESIDFNKKFNVFAEEELTAFYILTPDIMEAIFALERRYPGNISFSFSDQQMYLGINNNKNTFELQLFKPLSLEAIQEFEKDLLVVKDVIHSLKLNNSIFKKREDL
ncbi:DUF3137 domain-containing protein [Hujiaoplasma nucleasis]|uniref:DUF3137 domain-containing protein n=1 Tax=Hujiaoplasma nucleasis TaxID=2725268 RepID=A0A7L6N358_9MOLU|nr:DUF3137 domain-containing protein [Hujiaoplasma nucleasis]QLY39648.1 DUF3137 domain-containing protein [Hujiaoplasma nucleasis]